MPPPIAIKPSRLVALGYFTSLWRMYCSSRLRYVGVPLSTSGGECVRRAQRSGGRSRSKEPARLRFSARRRIAAISSMGLRGVEFDRDVEDVSSKRDSSLPDVVGVA